MTALAWRTTASGNSLVATRDGAHVGNVRRWGPGARDAGAWTVHVRDRVGTWPYTYATPAEAVAVLEALDHVCRNGGDNP